MNVRAATLTDLPRIVEIEKLCFPEELAFPPGMFTFLIHNARTLVSSEDGLVTGFIIGYASGRTGIIYSLDVHPGYRRRGAGSALIKALEEELYSDGVRRYRLEAALSNPEARDLYHHLGYAEGELLRDYYGSGKDAVRMWKSVEGEWGQAV
ncbi:MAG: GNAT family N-acetyltransferase [Methanosarcinales archaeon]|nr:GNAT family N-acetyltransferase [Methanosarcinales archaeon]